MPFTDPEGTRHAYDNATTYVLARMVEHVTGRGLPELLDDRLFAPMGVDHAEWDRVASGASFGFHGLHLRTEAVAAFGELLLRVLDGASRLRRRLGLPAARPGRPGEHAGRLDPRRPVAAAVVRARGGCGGAATFRQGGGRRLGGGFGPAGRTFVADLVLVTTPHRVRLHIDDGRATATWSTVPPTGPDPVLHLRAPLMTRPDVA